MAVKYQYKEKEGRVLPVSEQRKENKGLDFPILALAFVTIVLIVCTIYAPKPPVLSDEKKGDVTDNKQAPAPAEDKGTEVKV